jgi:hypothetical protein
MSRHVKPSGSAAKQRTEATRALPVIAQKAAQHIVGQLEPRFSEAYARGEAETFESFILGQQAEPGQTHFRVIDDEWFKENDFHGRVNEVCEACAPLVQQLLEEQYGLAAHVEISNGGSPEFVFDWYNCEMSRPRKKRAWWRFWQS